MTHAVWRSSSHRAQTVVCSGGVRRGHLIEAARIVLADVLEIDTELAWTLVATEGVHLVTIEPVLVASAPDD